VDGDGRLEVGQALYDGRIEFVAPTGESLPQYTLSIPPLVVQTNWHVGLNPDAVDHSHPDVDLSGSNGTSGGGGSTQGRRRRLLQTEGEAEFQAFQKSQEVWNGGSDGAAAAVDPSADLLDGGAAAIAAQNDWHAAHHHLGMAASTDATAADYSGVHGGMDTTTSTAYDQAFSKQPVFPGMEEPAGPGTLRVDAHVLCSPTLGDLDGDGLVESLVVAVSYFFDKDTYAPGSPARAALPPDLVLSNYLATGLVVFDLRHARSTAGKGGARDHAVNATSAGVHHPALKWKLHLDLSTDAASYKAFAYSTPVVGDVDSDGVADILVGTSAGYVYCVSATDGSLRRGYPLQLGEVQASPGLADVDGDGALEVVVADTRGSVAAFVAATGAELWERHVASAANQGPSFGDVDGDRRLEVVLGTSDGRVHVLRGDTGADVPHFPYATGGRVMAPVTPVPVSGDRKAGLTLLVASFDGHVHLVHGPTGCGHTFDVGETMYAAPLTADLDGDGKTDIVVATMNGNVLCISTPWTHHPTMTWHSQTPDGNAVARGASGFGVHISAGTRAAGDVSGRTLRVTFTIQDGRRGASQAAAAFAASRQAAARAAFSAAGGIVPLQDVPGPYRVVLRLAASDGVTSEVVVFASYTSPGTYALAIAVPPVRGRGVVTVTVWDAHALAASDTWPVSLHGRFARLLKWFLAAPYLAVAAAALWALAAGDEVIFFGRLGGRRSGHQD
jgi:outer membrane protein assembly factor BamB